MTDNRPIHIPEYRGHAPDWYKEGMEVECHFASEWRTALETIWAKGIKYRPAEPLEPSAPTITIEQALAALEAHGIDTSSIPKPVDPLLAMLREVALKGYRSLAAADIENGECDTEILVIADEFGFVPGNVK